MNIKSIKHNMTVLKLNDLPEHGTEILISYQTPVAAYTPEFGWIRTNKFWSKTTSRHINQWIGKVGNEVEQTVLDNLLNKAQ